MGEGRKTRGSQVPSTLGMMLVSAAACLLSDISSPELILHTGTNEEIMSFAPEITSAQAELWIVLSSLTLWHYHKIIFMQNPAVSAVPVRWCTWSIGGVAVIYNHFVIYFCKFGSFLCFWFELACYVWSEMGGTWAVLILDFPLLQVCLCSGWLRPAWQAPARHPGRSGAVPTGGAGTGLS